MPGRGRFSITEKAPIENKYVLYVEDLKVSFGKGKKKKEILKGVTFGLRQGETLTLLGANGAGKTVLLETVLGMIKPDSYKDMMLNLGQTSYKKNLKEVGIQYQQSKMPASMTVKYAIKNFEKLYRERVDEQKLEEMIDVFGVRPFIGNKVESLSGGQKQRLNLLFAIMHQPKIMILDEFITGLDVKSVKNIVNYVNKLKVENGASMIIVSHQPEEIEELSDRVVVLKDGKVERETYVDEIQKEFGSVASFVEGL